MVVARAAGDAPRPLLASLTAPLAVALACCPCLLRLLPAPALPISLKKRREETKGKSREKRRRKEKKKREKKEEKRSEVKI
jgi:hypothetical protein